MGFTRKIQRKQFVQQKKAVQKIIKYKKKYWYVRSIEHTIDNIVYTIRQDKDYSITLSNKDGVIGTRKATFGIPDKTLKDFVEYYHNLYIQQKEGTNE